MPAAVFVRAILESVPLLVRMYEGVQGELFVGV